MVDRQLTLTCTAVAVPWLAALTTRVVSRHLRIIGFSSASISLGASLLLMRSSTPTESLNAALMVLFSCLTLGAMLVLPHRDMSDSTIGGILFLLGSTLLAYSTSNLLVLLIAWTLTTVP